MIKKIFLYTLCLLPWFFVNILSLDYSYYEVIQKPFFAPPNYFYAISWTIIYIFIAYTLYSIFIIYIYKEIPISFWITLLINYLFNQGYPIVFFGLKNSFLGFIFCVGNLLSTFFLWREVSLLQNKKKYYLVPYILLGSFAVLLSLSIYILNN